MENTNRINPYTRLLGEIREFCSKLKYSHNTTMLKYPLNKLDSGWKLSEVYQRVSAADQLGYEVLLEANDYGLRVYYRKKMNIPMKWRY